MFVSSLLATGRPRGGNKKRMYSHLMRLGRKSKGEKKQQKKGAHSPFLFVVWLLAPVQLFVLSFRPATTLSSPSPVLSVYMKHFQGKDTHCLIFIQANVNRFEALPMLVAVNAVQEELILSASFRKGLL